MVSAAAGRLARGAVLAVGLLAAVSGCGRAPAPGTWTETRGDPLERLRERSEAADRLQASLELVWEDPVTGEREGCSAFLVWSRDEGLRVLARSVAFVTVFEMVADRESVWLDVPREGITVVGARDDPDWTRLPASPRAFLVALFADPWAGREESGPFRRPGPDRLAGDGWTLRLDPGTGLPLRYEREGLSIEWGDWALRHGVPWPHEAEIRTDGGVLRARLGRLVLGRPGSPGQFEFTPGKDRTLLTPAEARERWESAGEAPERP